MIAYGKREEAQSRSLVTMRYQEWDVQDFWILCTS